MAEQGHYHAEVLENGHFTERRKCFNEGTSPDPRGAAIHWMALEVANDKCSNLESVDQEFSRITDSLAEFERGYVSDSWEESVRTTGHPSEDVDYRIMSIDGACEETIDRDDE